MGSRQQGSLVKLYSRRQRQRAAQNEAKEIRDVSPAPGVQGTSLRVAALRAVGECVQRGEVGGISDVLECIQKDLDSAQSFRMI